MKKNKKIKKAVKEKKLTLSLPAILPIKTKSPVKKSSPKTKLYYQCMNACCKGKNITKVAQECKTNAPALVAQKNQAIKKEVGNIKKSWKTIGESLMRIVNN